MIMTLEQQIQEDIKAAMKAKEADPGEYYLDTLTMTCRTCWIILSSPILGCRGAISRYHR